jgi:hypothetical protein
VNTGPIREIRAISAKYLLSAAVCVLLALTFAASAGAQVTTSSGDEITVSPDKPSVNQTITFQDVSTADCPKTYTFSVDGVEQPSQPQASDTTTARFTTTGSHTVSVHTTFCGGSTSDGSVTFTVRDAVSGSIASSPEQPAPNQTTTLTASATGGYPGYTFAWDLDGNGSYETQTGSTRHVDTSFATTGGHQVGVEITDSAGHTGDVRHTVNVVQPAPGAQPPPSSPAPPCVKTLDFALSEFTTDGCFTQTGTEPSATYQTTDAVALNGIHFADFGQTFTITTPTTAEPGGHFTAPNSSIQLDNFHAFSGDIDWSLPNGKAGDEKELTTFSVFAGTKILGLNVLGTIALRLGFKDGTHYASFPLHIELPGGFRAGPGTDYGRVTGTGALRVDLAKGVQHVQYDGLQLRATNVWIGKVKVEETCFSYVPAGSESVTSCPQPSFDGTGTPYITCGSDPNTDRWDGNAVVLLPSGGSSSRLGAFGGVANGQLANLGATLALKKGLPIAPSVTLNSIAFGLCLTPPPLKIKGTIGIGILPLATGSVVGIDGTVEYTDTNPYGFGGWTLAIGGSVTVFDKNLGHGSVTIRAYNGFDFDVASKVDLYGIASLEGEISGLVDANRNLFNISGSAKACVATDLCAQGSGVVSSTGIAGCITITSTIHSPDLLVTFDPLSVRFDDRPLYLSAGFGYRWGASSPDLLGASCDFSSYSLTRSFARAAGTGISERIRRGTAAVALRIHGSHGVPKVVVHGPDGTRITSPSTGTSAQRKGRYLLAENAKNGTTNVLLIHPAAGTWTVSAAPGAKSLPTVVDRSKFEIPPTFGATVRPTGATRNLTMVYAVPKGASVRLVERAKGIARTIAGSVHGSRCPAGPKLRPGSDQQILCAHVRFRPSRGPGGTRKVQAVVSRGGLPMLQKDIASFTAPAQTLPSRPGALRARRANGFLVVAFPRSRGASRYAVSAVMSDGRELAFDLASKCRAVRIANVPTDVAATVKVRGVRYDLQSGARSSISIPSNVAAAGPRGKLPRRLWRPRRACS